MKKREHGDGGIDERGAGVFRLRYRLEGQRYSITFRGSRAEAKTELRRLIRSGETGEHVAPDRITVGAWIEHWIGVGAPGRKKKPVRRRTLDRYAQLLRCHVAPSFGSKRLQQLAATDIDRLYDGLDGKLAPRTAHHVHVVLNGCLNAAVRKGLLQTNPISRAEKIPSPGESDHGQVLDETQITELVRGFQNSVLYPLVAAAAFTGARRNELLALRWADFDPQARTLRIERAMEEAKGSRRSIKEPKTARGKRTIEIDESLAALLAQEREKHLRWFASVPDGAPVDLSLIKLPDGALVFPSTAGVVLDLTRLRDAHAVTRGFTRWARRLGFPGLRFHDLRGSHETILLDKGVPLHVVAARCGHDPAELLRSYAKRTRKADTNAAAVIGELSKNVLGR